MSGRISLRQDFDVGTLRDLAKLSHNANHGAHWRWFRSRRLQAP
ncbi:hypothetical protein [Roseibium sp. SCP14]